MNFLSTRNKKKCYTLSQAIDLGLAEDGGLFVPDHFPKIAMDSLDINNFSVFAQKIMAPYFANDELHDQLIYITEQAFTFPIVLKPLDTTTAMLELFHGPTASFKDFGARFLAQCLRHLAAKRPTTIMVATSGDTGSAVASAFYRQPNINVIILYPQGKISARQEHQITCWDTNVLALAVDGVFDDCQKLLKEAFHDPAWNRVTHLNSSNSINIGRLLPQIIYYAFSSMRYYQEYHAEAGIIVPSGNIGNVVAGYWAKAMGFPIRELVIATNANTTMSNYYHTGKFIPQPSVATLANAMDVGNPSNFERLNDLFPDFTTFKKNVTVMRATDDDIRHTIQKIYHDHQTIICPHTATAFFAKGNLPPGHWIIAATADPSKFETIIEPLLHVKIPVAAALQTLLQRPTHHEPVEKNLEDILAMAQKKLSLKI